MENKDESQSEQPEHRAGREGRRGRERGEGAGRPPDQVTVKGAADPVTSGAWRGRGSGGESEENGVTVRERDSMLPESGEPDTAPIPAGTPVAMDRSVGDGSSRPPGHGGGDSGVPSPGMGHPENCTETRVKRKRREDRCEGAKATSGSSPLRGPALGRGSGARGAPRSLMTPAGGDGCRRREPVARVGSSLF